MTHHTRLTLLLCVTMIVVPGFSSISASSPTIDRTDATLPPALLLMLASHRRMHPAETWEEMISYGNGHLASPPENNPRQEHSSNEIVGLAMWYYDHAEKLQKEGNPLSERFYERAEEFSNQALDLTRREIEKERRRERRRNNPFRRFVRGIPLFIGKTVEGVMGTAAETTAFAVETSAQVVKYAATDGPKDYIVDQLELIRYVVKHPVQAISQQPVELMWDAFGSRYGAITRNILRNRIDPAFIRWRDRLTGRERRRRQAAAGTATAQAAADLAAANAQESAASATQEAPDATVSPQASLGFTLNACNLTSMIQASVEIVSEESQGDWHRCEYRVRLMNTSSEQPVLLMLHEHTVSRDDDRYFWEDIHADPGESFSRSYVSEWMAGTDAMIFRSVERFAGLLDDQSCGSGLEMQETDRLAIASSLEVLCPQP